MRVKGEFPAAPSKLLAPRGFSSAPLSSVGNNRVFDEDSLALAIRELTAGRLGSQGRVIEIGGPIRVTRTITIPPDAQGLVLRCNRAPFLLDPGVSLLFDVRASYCVFEDLVTGLSDSDVSSATAFKFVAPSVQCVVRNALVRCTTFATNSGGLNTRIQHSDWLQAEGAVLRSYSSHDGFEVVSDTLTAGTPIAYAASTWTGLTNDGLGGSSSSLFLPFGISAAWSVASSTFSFAQYQVGDVIDLRFDFSMTPGFNNALMQFRLVSSTFPTLDISSILPALSKGSGVAHNMAFSVPFVLPVPGTLLGTLTPQIFSDKSGTVVVDFFGVTIRKLGA